MYEANEKLLSHIENFDALSTSAGEQTFKNFGQGAGEKTFEDSSKPGIKDGITEWIKANMAASIIAGLAFLALITLAILAIRKLNQLKNGVKNETYESRLDTLVEENKITSEEKKDINNYAKYVAKDEQVKLFKEAENALKKCLRLISQQENAQQEGASPENASPENEQNASINELIKSLSAIEKLNGNNTLLQKTCDLFEPLCGQSEVTSFEHINFTKPKAKTSAAVPTESDVPKPEENQTNNETITSNATQTTETTMTLSQAFGKLKAALNAAKVEYMQTVKEAKKESPGVIKRIRMTNFTKCKTADELKEEKRINAAKEAEKAAKKAEKAAKKAHTSEFVEPHDGDAQINNL